MQDTRAARRYAEALYEVAQDRNLISTVEEDLNSFIGVLHSNDEFRSFYNAPETSRSEKNEILDKIFSDRISPLALQLIKLLQSKGRGREVGVVATEFARLRRERSGVVYAHVTSSVLLTDVQKAALSSKLQAVVGSKIEADYALDPHLIGGIKVAYNNDSIDGSVRGALQTLKNQFHHDVLKQA